ncbi:DUF6762 family protein [uncultured Clostridium sp.]|jgi:hypothetical protein|uniref:DUF6762 family protein n=1 Tax=uncultured Clostridium sp. TaxID=59620 RepID=UPI002605E43C|nr:DUF6762 family protein [uncultured Clostridium sp.]
MDFSSLVLMEKDNETGFLGKNLGSFSVEEGAEYVRRLFVYKEEVNVVFNTKRDVEEWEFSAIFDLFNVEAFTALGYNIEDDEEEYNPTWLIKFKYEEEIDHEKMRAIINEICNLIDVNMKKVFLDIEGKEEEYK